MHLATRLDRYSPSCISIGPGHGRIPHSPTPIGIGPGAGENTAHYSAQGLPLPPRVDTLRSDPRASGRLSDVG